MPWTIETEQFFLCYYRKVAKAWIKKKSSGNKKIIQEKCDDENNVEFVEDEMDISDPSRKC